MQTQVSSSAYQAKAILGAWHSGDRNRLFEELDRVNDLRPVDSAEEERLELLSEIARELRNVHRPSENAVFDSLLEHLASPAQQRRSASHRNVIRPSEYGRAAAATALQ
jgi:hypothetical protein